MRLHLYLIRNLLLNSCTEDFNVLHFSTLNLDAKLLKLHAQKQDNITYQQFQEKYYSLELITKKLWLKKRIRNNSETWSLKEVKERTGFLLCKEFKQEVPEDKEGLEQINKKIKKAINKSLEQIEQEGSFVTLSIYRCRWDIGNGVCFYVDSSRQYGTDQEFYVICGCKGNSSKDIKQSLTKFGLPVDNLLYPVDSKIMAHLKVHKPDFYVVTDHSEPAVNRYQMYRNGNPLDTESVLPLNAKGEEVLNWWKRICGTSNTAVEHFTKWIGSEMMDANKLYSQDRDFFLPREDPTSYVLSAIYFRLHMWKATLKYPVEEYVERVKENPQLIKQLNRLELAIILNDLSSNDKELLEAVTKESQKVQLMKTSFVHWQRIHVPEEQRVGLY